MSLQAMKRKHLAKVNLSAKAPGGIWLGAPAQQFSATPGPVGFSINGGIRPNSYVGKTYAMSQSGTPFIGQFAVGHGGNRGRYVQTFPLMNMTLAKAAVEGGQFMFIKNSVVGQRGMLAQRYACCNDVVKPIYPNDNLSANSSAQAYLDYLSWIACRG